jgi:hypothetical protein
MLNKLIAICLLGTAKLKGSDDALILRALAIVETANALHPEGDDAAVGPCMSRGRLQLSKAVWSQHAPDGWRFSEAHNKTKAEAVGLMHLRWLRKQLEEGLGRPPEVKELGYAWLRGWSYYTQTMRSRETQQDMLERLAYGQRLENFYNELKSK